MFKSPMPPLKSGVDVPEDLVEVEAILAQERSET